METKMNFIKKGLCDDCEVNYLREKEDSNIENRIDQKIIDECLELVE